MTGAAAAPTRLYPSRHSVNYVGREKDRQTVSLSDEFLIVARGVRGYPPVADELCHRNRSRSKRAINGPDLWRVGGRFWDKKKHRGGVWVGSTCDVQAAVLERFYN